MEHTRSRRDLAAGKATVRRLRRRLTPFPPAYYLPLMNRTSYLLAAVFAVLLLSTSAVVLARLSDISSGPRAGRPLTTSRPVADAPPLRIGVVSRFAPNVIFAVYQPLIDHLNRQGGRRYELKLSGSYLEAVEDLKAERVAASFLGAWIYGRMASDPDLIPLVAPLNTDGVSAFRVALVTGPEGDVTGAADLRGRRVALPSPQSWSGNWLQTAALPACGLDAADLDSLHHFDHHQTVAREVMRGAFDAGVVKQTVYEKYRDQGLRVLQWSEPIPGPPLVASAAVPADVREEIRAALLSIRPETIQARAKLWSQEFRNGFAAVDAAQYRRAFAADAAEGDAP